MSPNEIMNWCQAVIAVASTVFIVGLMIAGLIAAVRQVIR